MALVNARIRSECVIWALYNIGIGAVIYCEELALLLWEKIRERKAW